MKFMCLIYHDPRVLEDMAPAQFDDMMRECLGYDDRLAAEGKFVTANRLYPHTEARTLRMRGGKLSASDGPFAETKEVLGGYQIIEARDLDEACEIAAKIPWTRTGSVEVRPVLDQISSPVGGPPRA